jgi:hypothetical protein
MDEKQLKETTWTARDLEFARHVSTVVNEKIGALRKELESESYRANLELRSELLETRSEIVTMREREITRDGRIALLEDEVKRLIAENAERRSMELSNLERITGIERSRADERAVREFDEARFGR